MLDSLNISATNWPFKDKNGGKARYQEFFYVITAILSLLRCHEMVY